MTPEPNLPQPVFTRERVLTSVLAMITLLVLYACYRLIEPFIPSMAFALALAVATQAPYGWLRRRLGGRSALAAGLAVVLVATLIIGPAAFLTTYIVQMAVHGFNDMQNNGGFEQVRAVAERQPVIGPLLQEAAARFQLDEQFANISRAVASRASGVLSGSVSVLTQLGITLFVLFFLYRDCGEALQAARRLLPLSHGEADRLFDRVGSTISATVNGSLTVALVQAMLAGVVYVALGVPLAVLWGAVTFLAALVPVFGTFVVWAPIAVYLLITGSYIKAIFLAAWGVLVVGSVDNILYPYLVGDKLRMHTVPTFFAVLGGLSLFGPAGLILGPMVLALAIAFLDVWWHRTEHGSAAEEAVAPHAEDPKRPGSVLQERGIRTDA